MWVGKDSNKPMKGVTGGGAPAEIWNLFMDAALPSLRVTEIPVLGSGKTDYVSARRMAMESLGLDMAAVRAVTSVLRVEGLS